MLELTLVFLIGALIFFILRTIFKSDEFNAMSTIICVLALAMVVRDESISDDLIFFVCPLVYGVLISALSLIPGWGERK